ncbi:MAG: hypothetical protein ACXW0Q_05345 [Methylovulum sp.]
MNSKLVSVLVAVCVALIFIIIAEWLYATQIQNYDLTETGTASKQVSRYEMPTIKLDQRPEESYAALVARPLFIKGRRPVDEPTPEEKQTIATAANFDWVLTGVYSTKKGLSALFGRANSKIPKDNYRKIVVGDNLDGWKLTEVLNDRVILSQGDSQKELLLRKPKLKELPQARTKLRLPPHQPVSAPPVPAPPIVPPEVEPEIEADVESTEDSLENGNNE